MKLVFNKAGGYRNGVNTTYITEEDVTNGTPIDFDPANGVKIVAGKLATEFSNKPVIEDKPEIKEPEAGKPKAKTPKKDK